jgi:hypothetical protein
MGKSRNKNNDSFITKPGDDLVSLFPKRQRKRKAISSEGPQFEVTGQHVVLFVSILFAAAWLAGLLPDP